MMTLKKPSRQGHLRRVGAFLWSWPHALVLATVVVLVAVNILWLERFRYGFPLDIDEAGYLSIGFQNAAAFESGGLGGFW